MTESPDEILAIELDPDEWMLLHCGVNEWGGPARCTEELAIAMGFEGLDHLSREIYGRLLPALRARTPMTRLDWLRVLLATEIVFASAVMGSGRDWPITTGIRDEETIAILRPLQRKILMATSRRLVGNGLGTRQPRPPKRM